MYQRSGAPIGSTDLPIAMSNNFIALGKTQDARDVLDRFVTGRERLGVSSQIRLQMQRASTLAAIGNTRDAETLAQEQLERVKGIPVRQQLRPLEADIRIALGRLLLQREETKAAFDLIEPAMKWRTEDLSSRSPLLADSEVALAQCLVAMGDTSAARQLFLQARAIHENNQELSVRYTAPLAELGTRLGLSAVSRRRP
jgi:tetratricopeptide (TPR) repeat protein